MELGQSRGDTVHFDIVDSLGNMIAATPSGGWLQSSPTIPALGFCLGTRAQMFVLEQGQVVGAAQLTVTRESPAQALRLTGKPGTIVKWVASALQSSGAPPP